MGNRELIYAGEQAGGTDYTGLAWFGETTAVAPTSALLPATPQYADGWDDAGMVVDTGISAKFTQELKKIRVFGTTQVVKTLVTGEETSYELSFAETNLISTAIWTRQAVRAYTAAADGSWTLTHGPYSQRYYSVIFETVSGLNHVRTYVPNAEVTDRKERKSAAGEVFDWGVTLTAYPDASGNTSYEYILMDALAA